MLESKGPRKRTRAWRRHHRRRMIAKAWRIAKERYPHPKGVAAADSWLPWQDIKGQWRTGPVAWEDVFALRDEFAHRHHSHLTACSCWMCGNPRRFRGERTLQERRAEDSFRDESAETLQD